MLKSLPLIAVCLALAGCGGSSLRILAIGTMTALDVYTTVAIEEATPEERAEIKSMLESIQPYTDATAAIVNDKLALIDALDG